MKTINKIIIILSLIINTPVLSNDSLFNNWLITFKEKAQQRGISNETINKVMSEVKFIPKVIEYDRFQPEFYEDTKTYILKRTSNTKVKKGTKLYLNNKLIIDTIDKKFSVEKDLLLALMGIETNFGTYMGKMDIISSLATLSFDKRRSDFFTNELITILELIDKEIIDYKTLYGSWAGAFGNFQFMPTTIKRYALDYNSDYKIDLKNLEDSFASAANYIHKIGWSKNAPCYIKIDLLKNIPNKYLNTSAKKIHSKKKIREFRKYIKNYENLNIIDDPTVAIITPDIDIIPDAKTLEPAYLIFNNYELILKWNRSLRFALAVCKLKNKFKNEL
jgi:membrane-bound lytic murein transglycosylase B|tara:strand:+ start:200 stop:1198 length:999 start_codon:yes stop_codon:yes gene_type:complete